MDLPSDHCGQGRPAHRSVGENDLSERIREANSLMRALAGDDPEGLDGIMRLHWGEVVGYAAGFVESGDQAEDLAQRAFIGLWKKRKAWEERGSVLSFLLRVVRNLASNERRRRRIRFRLEAQTVAATARSPTRPDEQLARTELQTQLEWALLKMPTRRREVFELARFQGLTYAEIADVLEISPQTVANLMSAALSQLREELGVDTNAAPPGDDGPKGPRPMDRRTSLE